MQSAPNHGIGRVCKVSKEEVVGQISSLIWWAEQDEEERMIEHHRKSGLLLDMVKELPGAKSEVVFPDHSQRPYPTVHVTPQPQSGLSGQELLAALRSGDPPIAGMTHPNDPGAIRLDVRLLEDEEIAAIGTRLAELLG